MILPAFVRHHLVVLVIASTLCVTGGLSVDAQAPDSDRSVYTNTCIFEESGDTWGEGLVPTKSPQGYAFQFVDFTSIPHPPVAIDGRIVGEKISFEFKLSKLSVRFSVTITPNEIKGRYANDGGAEYYNSEVRLEGVLPGEKRGYCH